MHVKESVKTAFQKYRQFLFMCFKVLCIAMYGTIKIYATYFYATGTLDFHNMHNIKLHYGSLIRALTGKFWCNYTP